MKESIERISTEFYNKFYSSHVILLIGQNVKTDEVKDYISKVRWSAIFTTNSDPEFASLFASENRILQTCSSRQDLSTRFLSREKPLLIQLFGVDGELINESSIVAPSPFGEARRKLRKAAELLNLIPSLLDPVNYLVVTGFDSEEDENLLDQLGDLLQNEISQGSVSFWGMEKAFPGKPAIKEWLKTICEQKSFDFYDTDLAVAIKHRTKEEQLVVEDEAGLSTGDDLFFCNQKPVSIEQDTLLRIKNIGSLLTERTINRVRPLGRSQQRMWFSNFLERSGIGEPQWYGYLSQSSFHVMRDYEDALVQLVRRALKRRDISGESVDDRPIVLSGAPGSSKSVTLGALAYRIYNERINPVLFVSGAMQLGNSYGSVFHNLLDSLETIQANSNSAAPVLVIWDGSSYREIESDAKRLLTNLLNRGRRVVLVCSSYSLPSGGDSVHYYSYDSASEAFESCETIGDAAIGIRPDYTFVLADRLMSERECYRFWQKASLYSGIPDAHISFLKKKFAADGEADIFNYYYGLISLLRERLERSLEGERDKVAHYLQEERPEYLNELLERKTLERKQNQIYQALLDAGLTDDELSELSTSDQQGSDKDELYELWVRANTFIALFSKYKIDTPYSFVYAVIIRDGAVNPYSETSRELLDILTTLTPWLSYGENEDEEFVFRFRNSLEAEIYLDRKAITGERLVGMVAEALNLYGESYQRERYENPRLAQKLQSIVRLMGPNSKYYSNAQRGHKDTLEHEDIKAHLDVLIEALEDLLNYYRIPDEDCGFASLLVTLTREYYGRNVWDKLHGKEGGLPADYHAAGFSAEDYKNRITRVSRASRIALDCEQGLEDRAALNKYNEQGQFLQRQANGLVVESTNCNLEVDDLFAQYLECCEMTNLTPDMSLAGGFLPYSVQYRKLVSVIRYDPVNGYAYNALFKLFEREYQSDRCPDDVKLEYLAEIMAHVNTCMTYGNEIENRGQRSDELSGHLNRITDFASDIPASIETVESSGQFQDVRNASLFMDIYNRFLEEGNPAAILFVAQKEISQLKLQDNLSALEMKKCQKVLDFMTEQKRYGCVCSDPNALSFLIRVAWMSFTGTTLSAARECQTVALSGEKWRELYRYCLAYSQVVKPNMQTPLITVVFALATLQVGGKTSGSYTDAYNIIQPIREEQFNSAYRIKCPFIVCDESGEPISYTGKVIHARERNGYMQVFGLPQFFGGNVGVYFRLLDLGKNKQMPKEGEIISNLELGIGYIGFRVFTRQGREDFGRRQ